MPNKNFTTQVDRFIVNTEAKMLAMTQDALNETVQIMQTPTAKGGKMRVDTGFLRASGIAQLGSLPNGPSKNPGNQKFAWQSTGLELALSKMKLGDAFYWGWTANYAKYREAYDGFMEAALQNWQNQVNSSTAKIKKLFK